MKFADPKSSEKFDNLTILKDETFTTLDGTLRQIMEPLLRELVSIHSKVDEAVVSHVEDSVANSLKDNRQTDLVFLEDCLRFPTMTHRQMEIVEAHQKTFSWLLNEDGNHTDTPRVNPWDNFMEWLREDGEIYWANGKAGSGKSTDEIYCRKPRNETTLTALVWDNKTLHCKLLLL